MYDFITIVEAPDNGPVAHLSVDLGSRGAVKIETLAAMISSHKTQGIEATDIRVMRRFKEINSSICRRNRSCEESLAL
jgi:GYD domain-containing protein